MASPSTPFYMMTSSYNYKNGGEIAVWLRKTTQSHCHLTPPLPTYAQCTLYWSVTRPTAHQLHTQHTTSTHLPSLAEELLEFFHAHTLRELHAEHSSPVPFLVRDVVTGRLLWAVATESSTGTIDEGMKWVFICRYCSSLHKGTLTLWI